MPPNLLAHYLYLGKRLFRPSRSGAQKCRDGVPLQVFAEADGASQLFQYYLLDTNGFESNVFTAIIPGVNDGNVQLTATGGNCGLHTVAAVRVVLEPKPGLPTDPNNPRGSTMSSPTSPRYSLSTTRAAGTKVG